jgi:hypothetical protein
MQVTLLFCYCGLYLQPLFYLCIFIEIVYLVLFVYFIEIAGTTMFN